MVLRSRVQIGGPTGAFVVVDGIVARDGVDGLFMCTMLAGGILIARGVTEMVRRSVVGFTNGIAVLNRKEGTTTFYSVADPEIADLLRVAERILNRRLVGVQSLLRELADEQGGRRRAARSRG